MGIANVNKVLLYGFVESDDLSNTAYEGTSSFCFVSGYLSQ